MPFQKAENSGEQVRIADPGAQVVRSEPGQRQQPLGAGGIVQRPAQRAQRKRLRIGICLGLSHRLRSVPGIGSKAGALGQKILVVEDNELNLKLFCDLLRAHGYQAEPVRDGREALERARDFTPDLVIMDIQMPHISGLELIEQLKADEGLRAIPIMAVTAYAAKGDEERIRDAGAEGYVSKPISVIRFVDAVAKLLKEREPVPEVESSAIDRVEYDDASRTLEIWYSGGDRYSYFEVPREKYDALLAAESIGGFVNAEIKPHYGSGLDPARRRLRPLED